MPGGRKKRKWLVLEESSTDFTEGTGGEFTLYFYVNEKKMRKKKKPHVESIKWNTLSVDPVKVLVFEY